MKSLLILGGWMRLRFGFCPMCFSSPPDPTCFVCWGDREYGHAAKKPKREMWWQRFKEFYG